MERSLVNLTVRVVEEVRSLQLSRLLWAIAGRLGEALENRFLKRVWERGRELALRLSGTAHSWGNGSALGWAEDRAYVFHLGVCQVNAGSMLGRSL